MCPTMGTIKAYADKGVQTTGENRLASLVDPAVILVAPGVTQAHGNHTEPTQTFTGTCTPDPSLPSSKRKQILEVRRPVGASCARRILSMPENEAEWFVSDQNNPGSRVVSMPNYFRPQLGSPEESPVSLSRETSESYPGECELMQRYQDIPQTPSPPSSPESLLIINCGAQFSNRFLQRKHSTELISENIESVCAYIHVAPS